MELMSLLNASLDLGGSWIAPCHLIIRQRSPMKRSVNVPPKVLKMWEVLEEVRKLLRSTGDRRNSVLKIERTVFP